MPPKFFAKKNTFTISIDPHSLDLKYGITIDNLASTVVTTKTTTITDLFPKKKQIITSFMDEGKKQQEHVHTMTDMLTGDILPSKTSSNCFWCRHQFDSHPIGCPIRYISQRCYDTDGIFCSFNCCLSWIIDNAHNPLYKESHTLLLNIFREVNNNMLGTSLFPAPHWRMLKVYEGTLSITEFRESFNNIEYVDTKNLSRSLYMIPTGYIYEKNTKF